MSGGVCTKIKKRRIGSSPLKGEAGTGKKLKDGKK